MYQQEYSGDIGRLPAVKTYEEIKKIIDATARIEIIDEGIGPYNYGTEWSNDHKYRTIVAYDYIYLNIDFLNAEFIDAFHELLDNDYPLIVVPRTVMCTVIMEIKGREESVEFEVNLMRVAYDRGHYVARYAWGE